MTEIDFHTTIFNCYALWILPCVLVCVFLNFCLLLFFFILSFLSTDACSFIVLLLLSCNVAFVADVVHFGHF